MSETTATPGRRGTKPGTKQERNFEHVCAQCGVTFMGTARAVFCSRACNLRSWRARQPKTEEEATA